MGPSMMGFEQTDNQTEEKVAKIIHRRKKKSMPHLMEKDKVRPIIIGICGGPLTGKSDLAKKISESVSPYYKVCIIHMSDYYKILTEEEQKPIIESENI